MSTLLLENIDTLATFDDQRRVLKNAWILVRDNLIEMVGTQRYEGGLVDQRLDLSHYVVLPGFINLHHHFFQALLKNIPSLQNVSLFRWLKDMFYLMGEVCDEDLYYATKINVAELILSGCTTTVDHNYLPATAVLQHDTALQAAKELGIRYYHARGCNAMGQKDGAMSPDHLVEIETDIMEDTERLIQTYDDPKPGSMLRIVNAPSAPFSASPRFYRESIEMARRYGVLNHTHLAQSLEDDRFVRNTYGKKSVLWAQDLGWVGEDVWYAHATVLDNEEKSIIQSTGTGICNCPNSNMYTAAGVCDVTPMLKAGGFNIGIGVDGSAANNSSNMLHEVRNALLMQRTFFGADAIAPTQALELATLGGAKILQRGDLGVLAPGKTADIIGIDFQKLPLAGGIHDPIAGLVLCDVDHVDLSIINGKIRVAKGELINVDLPALIQRSNELSIALAQRAEKRYNVSLTPLVWRRAYPYDGTNFK